MSPATNPFGAIILAAGASTRLGYPKQTILFNGETLLDRAVRLTNEAGARETVVVLGARASEVRNVCQLRKCTVVENKDWMNGMGTSIRRGIDALHDVDGTLILTCDMPGVTTAHLDALVASGTVTASRYGSKTGVPAYFPRTEFSSLSQLEDSQGASRLLWGAATVPLAGGEFDVDTPSDVEALNRLENHAN
jgi:CTP:molybdopterin cytidylyltransferase MocA